MNPNDSDDEDESEEDESEEEVVLTEVQRLEQEIAKRVQLIEEGETRRKQWMSEKKELGKQLTQAKKTADAQAKAKAKEIKEKEKELAKATPKPKATPLTDEEVKALPLTERLMYQKTTHDAKSKKEKAELKAQIQKHEHDHFNRMHDANDDVEATLANEKKYYDARHEWEMFKLKNSNNITREEIFKSETMKMMLAEWNALKKEKLSVEKQDSRMISLIANGHFVQGSAGAVVEKEEKTEEEKEQDEFVMMMLMQNTTAVETVLKQNTGSRQHA